MKETPKAHILFVNDEPDICDLMRLLFDRVGYEAVIARNVEEGYALAQDSAFDLILIDWYFEDGTGIDLCRRIRAVNSHTPIFFYTAVAYQEKLREALESGAQGYFVKPVDTDKLFNTLSLYLKQQAVRRD